VFKRERGSERKLKLNVHSLYSSSNIRVIKSKRSGIGGACSIHEREGKYEIVVEKTSKKQNLKPKLPLPLLPFVLGHTGCFLSQLNSKFGSYKQSVELLGLGISPVARPLPTQDDINTEEARRDICALSGRRYFMP
jgi:hypothetical protein